MKKIILPFLVTAPLLAFDPPPPAKFRPQTIDPALSIGYGIAVADINGDQLDDIILVDARQTTWYQNPTWQKHTITGSLTEKDHVCVAACDINADGKAEIAIGAGWNPADTKTSGAVFALHPPTDPTQTWKHQPLHHEPTVHRMHWVKDASPTSPTSPASHFLAVLPLHGCGNTNGEGESIRFLGYRPQQDPTKDWQTFLIHQGFNLAHNFAPVRWTQNTTAESLLVAAKQGVHLIQPQGETGENREKWTATQLTTPPAGEVRLGTLPDGRRFITTVEPMHGHQVVMNPENLTGPWSEKRIVLDDTLNQGHGLASADFLATGYHQIAAGWREPAKNNQRVGIRLYTPTNPDGTQWQLHHLIDDNSMACEDLKVADLNADGKPDLIASGRATKNLIIYWNES